MAPKPNFAEEAIIRTRHAIDPNNESQVASDIEQTGRRIANPELMGENSAAALMGTVTQQRLDALTALKGKELPGLLAAGARNRNVQNPYHQQTADATVAAQMELLNQMRAQQAGPSIAAMQGQRAMAQNGQQALQAAAMGQGRGAMLQAQQGGAGMSGDIGQARLAEVMKSQAALGGAAGNLRSNALTSAGAAQTAGLNAQALADSNSRFNAGAGTNLSNSERDAKLNFYKMYERLKAKEIERNRNIIRNVIQGGSTAMSAAAS